MSSLSYRQSDYLQYQKCINKTYFRNAGHACSMDKKGHF